MTITTATISDSESAQKIEQFASAGQSNGYRPVPKPRRSLLNGGRASTKDIGECNGSMEDCSINLDSKRLFGRCQSLNVPSSSDAATMRVPPQCSPTDLPSSPPPNTAPPLCPVRPSQRLPGSPPPLPPRNPALRSRLLPPPISEVNKVATAEVSDNPKSPKDAASLKSDVSNYPEEVNSLGFYLSTMPSISSDCSTSYSSQSSHSIDGQTVCSLDGYAETAAADSSPPTANGASSILNGDCQLVGESVCFSGWIRITALPPNISLKKDSERKRRCWAVIRHNQLSFMRNEESTTPLLGPFDLYRCIFVGRGQVNADEVSIVFRDVIVTPNGHTGKSANNVPWSLLRFRPEDNIEFWIILLAKCQSPQVDVVQSVLDQVDVCGKIWVREGISGTWADGWAAVRSRILTHWTMGAGALLATDVRKMIMVKRDVPIADYCNFIENSTAGPILIALNGSSLYLQAECDMCTEIWFNFLVGELRRGGDLLEECRLTADEVPVIVDKCIRLVATYGLNQPGIYRRNGSAALARELLTQFREDPFNVQMKSVSDESINAVADILRSFFRQLSRPLIPEDVQDSLYYIAEQLPEAERVSSYQNVIFALPPVYFSTVKRLLAHLQQITAHADKNLATIDNIAKVFGPTVFTVDRMDKPISVETYAKAVRQTAVMRDLLLAFDAIFQTPEEEKHALSKLNELQEQSRTPKARAEGFLVPIHLLEKDHKCFNVQCEWSAAQAVEFRVERLLMASDASLADAYALYELAKSGQLERRVSGDESLKSIVLGRWLDWDAAGAGPDECYLLLKKNATPFQPQNVRPFADNIKFAEPGAKSFKTCQLRMECGTKVVQYSKTMKQQEEWVVDETLWFVGHEADRKPPFPHTLTFFTPSTKYRSKFAGYCVAFRDEVQREQWLNSVIVCRQEYLPTPLLQI